MAKIDSYKCDQCGKVKGEVNHWWMAVSQGGNSLTIYEWRPPLADFGGVRHLCGQSCVVKELNDFMAEVTK